jgi:hypothetical protein
MDYSGPLVRCLSVATLNMRGSLGVIGDCVGGGSAFPNSEDGAWKRRARGYQSNTERGRRKVYGEENDEDSRLTGPRISQILPI